MLLGTLRGFAAQIGFGPNFTVAATAAALALALGGSADAADLGLPVRAPPPLPIFSWTGFYVGADIGYGWGRDSTTEYFTGTNTLTGLRWEYKPKGVLGGLFAGYNYQTGPMVLGFETDIELADIKGGFNDPALGGAGDTRIDWQGSARGRLGFAADKVLFYGTGGLAYASIGHTFKNLVVGSTEATSGIRTGWTAGAGVEMAVTQNFLLRAEYRYSDFGRYRYDSLVTFPGLTGQQEPTFSTVRVGAAYKF
ncbi:outer membrane protein [Bradyrhizobium sp.]|uniref:outer membrane protein n=1 Tax=Bradyrhizobium sp. TaxID=376 RepID=UPI003C7828AD